MELRNVPKFHLIAKNADMNMLTECLQAIGKIM